MGYVTWRKVTTLAGRVLLKVSIGRCENRVCGGYHQPYHPAEEGLWVLPHYEYGLNFMVLIDGSAPTRRACFPGTFKPGRLALRVGLGRIPLNRCPGADWSGGCRAGADRGESEEGLTGASRCAP